MQAEKNSRDKKLITDTLLTKFEIFDEMKSKITTYH
jgi:hypothetical protein